MKHSVAQWLRDQALLTPGREPNPIRLTPGQFEALCKEDLCIGNRFTTSLGSHPLEVVTYHGKGVGDNVFLAPRLDLFTDGDFGVVSSANPVTSMPDNVACVEVLSETQAHPHLRAGDLVFLDMYRTKQGQLLQNDALYVASGAVFIARYDAEDGTILPFDNHVITKPAPRRMTIAMHGTDKVEVPRSLLSDGFVSGRRHDGRPNARCLYQEVTAVRSNYPCGIREADLVSFCTDLGTRMRIRGEYHYSVPIKHVLAVIDDAAIEREMHAKYADRARILAV